MKVSSEILAAQVAYAARPFAVRWIDSHASVKNRFNTLDDAYAYVQQMWRFIQAEVRRNPHRASDLRSSYLETPAGRVQLSYVLLCDNVSSYHA